MNEMDKQVRGVVKASAGYMSFAAIIGIIVGFLMLIFPGGTMKLMAAAFTIFQIILSIFILAYAISEGVGNIRHGARNSGIIYIIIGVLATALVWLFQSSLIYYVVAACLIMSGVAEVVAGFRVEMGRYFIIFLGVVNVAIGLIILQFPVVLPLLIAWYVLFWGVSRLLLSMELRRLARQ
jgi:uncharacterized membrane protein HdeD (DUF308 family)